jgi:hypothetical protein
MPHRKNFADRCGQKALLATPDKGFYVQDVIHKMHGPELSLCKFIRPAQIASDERANRLCIAGGIGNSETSRVGGLVIC